MDISIITPSYNMLPYLKCCAASIADQQGVEYEHIIIDGKSTDGTVEWLSSVSDIRYISEPDNGMYDAINKGLKLTDGEILAYLNCDEQYLPGTFEKVKKYFDTHPDIDLLFGSVLITDESGKLLSFRKAYRVSYAYITTSILYNLSCAMFIRRSIIDNNIYFYADLKDAADADFVLRVLKNKYKTDFLKEYLSVFTWTGKNMSAGENAHRESRELRKSAPWYIVRFSLLLNIMRYIEKLFSSAYFQNCPIIYEIYIPGTQLQRKSFTANKTSFKWPQKKKRY